MLLSDIEELDLSRQQISFSNNEILPLIHKALEASNSWDIGLGFFAFSGFRKLAWPLAKFLIEGGVIRLYCNEVLSEKDYNALIKEGDLSRAGDLFDDLLGLFRTLERGENDLFANCIAHLISSNKLKVRVLVRRDHGQGYSHQKDFIFRDCADNCLVLTGSANISENAFVNNNETMNAYASFWPNGDGATHQIGIRNHEEKFERFFSSSDAEWVALNIGSNELEQRIRRVGFRPLNEDELKNSMARIGVGALSELPLSLRRKIQGELRVLDPLIAFEPEFPYEAPFPYQDEAYQNWCEAGYKGLFAMATGTGKTLTAINCLVREYRPENHRFIFVVPGQELVRQWSEVLKRSNFGTVHTWFSGDGGGHASDVRRSVDRLRYSETSKITLVITYEGFCSFKFKDIFGEALAGFTIVFDECHGMGAQGRMKNMPDVQSSRLIGLSATPERQYDEKGGNEFIQNIFGCQKGAYTFEFSMAEAISRGFLVPYDYRLRFVHLNDEEWDKYKELTRKMFLYEEGRGNVINDTVARQRAQLVQGCEGKLEAVCDLMAEMYLEGSHYRTLIFCPIGKGNNEGEDDRKLIDQYLENLIRTNPAVRFAKVTGESVNRAGILQTFEEGEELDVLLSMKVLDEGLDIPSIRNAVLVASSSVHREHIQRRGRILRNSRETGKESAVLYDMVCLPPKSVLDAGEGGKAVLNEFRRIHEFASLADNYEDVVHDFNDFVGVVGGKFWVDYFSELEVMKNDFGNERN